MYFFLTLIKNIKLLRWYSLLISLNIVFRTKFCFTYMLKAFTPGQLAVETVSVEVDL